MTSEIQPAKVNYKSKLISLCIEHLPCCLLSAMAGFLSIPWFNHNPLIELGFAVGGALIGEYIGHRIFCAHDHKQTARKTLLRYAFALAIGIASWGVHQVLFHDHSGHNNVKSDIHATPMTDQNDQHS